ncbi:MAG: hypothetical protein EWM73_02267 [Nitrospira sp.]|nr:MAG: hypothetical protein EWM73_02267 [Nitrospira sp.]
MGELPTLAKFLETAQRIHQVTLESIELKGPTGRKIHQYLKHANGTVTFLPNIEATDQLTPVVFASLCRTLGIPSEEFGIPPEFLINPLRSLWDID